MLRRQMGTLLGLALGCVVVGAAALAAVDSDDELVTRDGTPTTERTTTTAEPPASTQAPTTTASTTTTAPPSSTTTATAPPVQVAATPSTQPPPPFRASVEMVTAEELGASWTPGRGCTPPEQLRALNLSHWGYDGFVHTGRLIVHADHADRIVAVFHEIYRARFPIQRMIPIAAYGGDDQASMRANNTSGYNCRTVAGSDTLSQHALGLAVDVNPLVNPYVKGSTVDPPEGAQYADREHAPGMIHAGDAVVDAFARQGWGWGGYWASGQDYQHFSATGT